MIKGSRKRLLGLVDNPWRGRPRTRHKAASPAEVGVAGVEVDGGYSVPACCVSWSALSSRQQRRRLLLNPSQHQQHPFLSFPSSPPCTPGPGIRRHSCNTSLRGVDSRQLIIIIFGHACIVPRRRIQPAGKYRSPHNLGARHKRTKQPEATLPLSISSPPV
ncbi:hypothetical protein VTJ04DRAFT_8539 [Mycothermus thermophilus]|uniref:uncharacterized protein n=1 Tax=Humicola insolens TaxID=85995 RepID=UPI0037446D06